MNTDVKDVIEIHDEVKKRLAETLLFAMENPARLRSYLSKLNYCINWGRTTGTRPTKVQVYPDHDPHSFIFVITTYKVSAEPVWGYAPTTPFTMGLIYTPSGDCWGTHS